VKLEQTEYAAIVRREIDAAQGYDSDVLAQERADALDYYNGVLPAISGEDRSEIVSHDVADCVNALMSQVMPMFTTSLLEFTPNSEEDEPQAQAESDYVRSAIEQADGFLTLYGAAFDALLQGNGWIKVTLEDKTDTSIENYPADLSDDELYQLTIPRSERETVDVTPVKGGGYEVTRTVQRQELDIRCVSPDVMLFSNSWDQFEFQDLRFVGERVLYTESDLLAMGVDQDKISELDLATNADNPAAVARESQYSDDTTDDGIAPQPAENLRECFDCYVRIDTEKNGTSELRNVLISGNHILREGPAECIPYATGSPICIPHRIQGIGMYQTMVQIQDAKTDILRKYIDQLEVNLLGRVGVLDGRVNLDDLLNGRLHGVVRMDEPGAVQPLSTPITGEQSIQGLNYLDSVMQQRGGSSVEMNDADRQVMKSSAAAAGVMVQNYEQMAGWYCSNMVNTMLKSTFALVHKTLRLESVGPRMAKLRGKWVQTVPSQWQERAHINVTAGMTTQERNNRIQGLTTVIQQQLGWIDQGLEGIITDRGRVFNAVTDWIRAFDLGDPLEYVLDPGSEEAQAKAQQQAQQAQQAEQQAQQMQQTLIEMQSTLERQKLELDKYKHDTDLKYKYFDSRLDATVSRAKGLSEEERHTTDAAIKLIAGVEGGQNS
jgi:hypothetical protein